MFYFFITVYILSIIGTLWTFYALWKNYYVHVIDLPEIIVISIVPVMNTFVAAVGLQYFIGCLTDTLYPRPRRRKNDYKTK